MKTHITSPLKWHGGKLARRIVALMPPHLHYVEPFAGGLRVLLVRDPDDSPLARIAHRALPFNWAIERGEGGVITLPVFMPTTNEDVRRASQGRRCF